MRSKRQTVWLVSMLSLMVILSAYYLFTEDSGSAKKPVADGAQVTTMDTRSTAGDDVVLNEVSKDEQTNDVVMDSSNGVITDDAITPDANTPDGTIADTKSPDNAKGVTVTTDKNQTDTGKNDEDVLKQLEAGGVSAADTLTAYQRERSENNIKKQDELTQAISDESKTLEEATMAQQQLGALEEKEAKITDIEERLQQQYANAVVTEDNDQYKVVVISDKLDAKAAVGIMDMVIKELGVSQDKVKVQYVSQ
ncbi:SpoIIIAH-like family protein [Paenibacillus segetis]|uniref:Stage III sporulation protein AH n=1 Tax=Paenibacillus segetis TaxID=1325360 RepID=A0ABQ1YGJ7_9BACL|nr:SpoIIIAH-like family protein [Paenibacillus segetis]GGH25167.1 hypothetical protein GCM10008013_25270 [Paenibacillus segetis]